MMYDENVQTIRFTKEDNLINGLSTKTLPTEIKFENFTCKWSSEQNEPTLNNINFTVPPKKLLAVIGPIGSGKVNLT